ncbi:calcineurin-like phosphoesterase C-terminal domain-containing protein [Lysobacter sp. A3-1-A15]|uniref:calcineurin-like phosphoesterase C-terminal domain-containing protein n=1 Tax=Novilysobacter viscosus TaxID=3098602 RepID=UPI003982E4E5
MRSLTLIIAVLSLAFTAHAAPAGGAACAGGMVFEDRNGNGRQDGAEPGLQGVVVSDGRTVELTAADGRYRMSASAERPLFVVKPATHVLRARGNGLPDHWRGAGDGLVGATGDNVAPPCRPFALAPFVPSPSRREGLQVLVFGDPQVKSGADVGYFERDIIEPLMQDAAIDSGHGFGALYFDGLAGDLGLSLGDIVDDTLSLYPGMIAATTRLGVPWLHVAGNHDLDLAAASDADSLATFRHYFGPDAFAWEEPEATFIVLDDVIHLPAGRPAYIGGLRDDQFAFLDAYLPTVARDRLLVLAVHIPLFDTGGRETFRAADRTRLFQRLAKFPNVLVLSAHSHVQQHVRHGAEAGWPGATPLHEYNVGASCGAFWSGAPDPTGIPDATMADGTPNGFARLRVAPGGGYGLSWHPARLKPGNPARTQAMHLHAPRVLRQGAYPAWGVYANVYMGEADSRVEYRVDGGPWQPMRRVQQPDPLLLAENVRDDASPALRGFDRSPEARPSSHLWRGALPTDLPAGPHRVEVRAFDRWQGEQRAEIAYRLDVAADGDARATR